MFFRLFKFFVFFLCSLLSTALYAFPDEEKSQLSLSGVSAQTSQMQITSDNRHLYLGFNDKLKVVDLATFDLASTQPYDFSSSSELDGIVAGVAISSSEVFLTKEDGDMLTFDRNSISEEPSRTTVSSSSTLGKVVINSAGTRLYILDVTNNDIIVYTIGSLSSSTISLGTAISTSFNITDIILVSSLANNRDYIYVTTDKGIVFYIEDGESFATQATVAGGDQDELVSLAVSPDNAYLYILNNSDWSVLIQNPLNPASQLVSPVELLLEPAGVDPAVYNKELSGIVSANVTNPTSEYTYISGLEGVSVLDDNNNLVDIDVTESLNFTPILIDGEKKGPLISSSDNYIYMSGEGGSISVITANPFVTISDVSYSGSGSSLGAGESVTVTFLSDEGGSYKVLVGGDVDESGTAILNQSGSSTGSITANTSETFTFNYDDNSSNLDEGNNEIFFFVTDSSDDTGRRMTLVDVDTPPPAVVIQDTSFGNTRIYLYITRLTQSDISHYNVYVSTDPDAVVNKTVSATQITQPTSGSVVTAEISGLDNGTTYYASVEAVDDGGNGGTLVYKLADGSRVSQVPDVTFGPAGLAGETGCKLSGEDGYSNVLLILVLFVLVLFILILSRLFSTGKCFLLLLVVFLFSTFSCKIVFAKEESPQWWSTELKGGFWMPRGSAMKRFFDSCCNMTGMVEQGFLYKSKLGFEAGIGFMFESGNAIAATSGSASGDRFSLFLMPMETSFVFRADFLEDQIIVPYTKVGTDYVYFRESLKGNTTSGVKTGMHFVGGVQILLDKIDQGAKHTFESDWGINDVYFTLEARYNWIDDFGGGGLDLSSLLFSFGLLFEY